MTEYRHSTLRFKEVTCFYEVINILRLSATEKLHFNITSSNLMLSWKIMDENTNVTGTLTGGHFKCKRCKQLVTKEVIFQPILMHETLLLFF
jgi:hypothetical protein